MGAKFNFSLNDLASNNTSNTTTAQYIYKQGQVAQGAVPSNPFLREFVKGSPSSKALITSSAVLARAGQNYDTYVSTSMLQMSDVMMGTPLANNTQGVLQTQQTLSASALQYGPAATSGNQINSDTLKKMSVYKALLPTDIAQVITGSSDINARTASMVTTTGGGSTVTPSSGVPTTTSMVTLPQGDGPNGLPPGYIQYPNTGVPVLEFLNLAISKLGDQYVWGAAGPSTFDCSGLVMWCLQQLSPQFSSWPHFTGSQYQAIVRAGLGCSLTEAYGTAGALLFVAAGNDPAGEHVAISLGNGSTVEAMNPSLGVRKGSVNEGTPWSVAGLIPGLDYSAVSFGNGISTMPSRPASGKVNSLDLGTSGGTSGSDASSGQFI
jgi:hypothetical protein